MSAKDIKVRPVDIHLDRPRTLLFDLNALEELEELYGDLETAFAAFQGKGKKIKHLKNFLFAGLVHEDTSLTPTVVGKLIGYNDLTVLTDQIYDAITGAISRALPEKEEGSEGTEGEA